VNLLKLGAEVGVTICC